MQYNHTIGITQTAIIPHTVCGSSASVFFLAAYIEYFYNSLEMSGSARSSPVRMQLSSSSPSLGMTENRDFIENEGQQLKSAVSTGRTSK